MGMLWSKKKVMWVPDNEKLKDKCVNPEQWDAQESFTGWKVCNDGCKIAKAMEKAKGCGNLDLSYCGLGDREAKAIAEALKSNFRSQKTGETKGSYKSLNLANNSIHAEGMKAIAEVLTPEPKTHYSLEKLDLSNNCAGADGADAISRMMGKNRTLRAISLRWNNIGNLGVIAICSNVKGQHKNAKIDISNNMFDFDEDGEAWFNMFTTVKKVLGADNLNGDDGHEGVIIGWEQTGLEKACREYAQS